MYNVMIVEDEKLVRIGLKNYVKWSDFDMEIAADAFDGVSAFELYDKMRIDLVITDLKMPNMDGLELIKKIRERDKRVRFVILTCLEQFEIARSAINLDVSGYIIKLTMTNTEIEEILGQVQKEMDLLQDKSAVNSLWSGEIARHERVIKMLSPEECSVDGQTGAWHEIGVDTSVEHPVLAVMEIAHFDAYRKSFDKPPFKSSFESLLRESIATGSNGEVIPLGDRRYLVLFRFAHSTAEDVRREKILSSLTDISKAMEKFFNIRVSFGVSETALGDPVMKTLYAQAVDSLEGRYFGGAGIFFHSTKEDYCELFEAKTAPLIDRDMMPGGSDIFRKRFAMRLRSVLEMTHLTEADVKDQFCKLVQWLPSAISAITDADIDNILSYTRQIEESETLDETVSLIMRFVVGIKDKIGHRSALSMEISLVVEYIEMNYCKNISLHSAAEQIYVSDSYLSALFKKELQINFIDYLIDLRIKKAKQLLLSGQLKVREIANKIGFHDITYFCKVFKKQTGVTPKEFRIRNRSTREIKRDDG